MSDSQQTHEGVFAHWPNRITAIRFVGAMVLFTLMGIVETRDALVTNRGMALVCLVLFVAVAATDWLDGHLARKHGNVTAFGRIADPFVDKILVLGSLILLAVLPWGRPYLPGWVVVLVLAREFLVTGIRGYVESLGLAFPADRFGKLKMVMQCVAIGVILLLAAVPMSASVGSSFRILAHFSVWFSLLLAVGSGASYVLKTRDLLSGPNA